MTAYRKLLTTGESLNGLVERLENKEQLENLIRDLLTGNFDMLVDFGYLIPDRFSDPQEKAIEWLMDIPFLIRKLSRTIFDRMIIEAVSKADWVFVDVLLGITNANFYGVSEKTIENISQNQHLPPFTELKFYLSLLNLEQSRHDVNIEKWKNRIPLENKPHLVPVLMSIFKKNNPDNTFLYLVKVEKSQKEIPPPDIRLVFLNVLHVAVLNHFNVFNKNEREFEDALSWFKHFFFQLQLSWTKELIIDIFSLSDTAEIRNKIEMFDLGFISHIILNDVMVTSSELTSMEGIDTEMIYAIQKKFEIKYDNLKPRVEQIITRITD